MRKRPIKENMNQAEKRCKVAKTSITTFFEAANETQDVPHPQEENMEEETDAEEVWECQWCAEEWDDDDGNRWIVTYSAPACNMRRMNLMILTLKIKYSVVTLVNNNLSLRFRTVSCGVCVLILF